MRPRGRPIRQRETTPEDFSPRVKLALRLYVHGVVKTQKEAALAAQLNPVTLSIVVNSPAGKHYMKTALELIDLHANDTNILLEKLSERAIARIGELMEGAWKEDIQLKAAIDLADRGPNTAKIQKHQVESYTLANSDARALAEAMVMAATVRNQNVTLATENFDKVNVDESDEVEPPTTQLTLLKSE